MFVIWNTTQKAYVAPPGLANSFTKLLERARKFTSRDAAKADCCGNEIVVDVLELLWINR